MCRQKGCSAVCGAATIRLEAANTIKHKQIQHSNALQQVVTLDTIGIYSLFSAITTARSTLCGTELSAFMTVLCDYTDRETSCVLNVPSDRLGKTCSLSRWSGFSSPLVIHAYGCQIPCPCNHWETDMKVTVLCCTVVIVQTWH